MSYFESSLTEALQRDLIIKAASEDANIEALAIEHGLDLKALERWIALYKLHGESILSPEQRAEAELELQALKALEEAPDWTLRDYAKMLALPVCFGGCLLLFGTTFLKALLAGVLAGCSFLSVVLICFLIIWAWDESGRAVERIYSREYRKIVSKREVVAGALQIAVDGDDLQGGLALAQEVGSLQEASALEPSERVVFDHAPDADVASEEVAARDLGEEAW